jgi:hypothetical protein
VSCWGLFLQRCRSCGPLPSHGYVSENCISFCVCPTQKSSSREVGASESIAVGPQHDICHCCAATSLASHAGCKWATGP